MKTLNTEILTQKEKELIAVGTAVSAGCQRCSDYHFKKVLEVGASLDEVKMAVIDATDCINHADEMMQRKAYELMEVSREDVPLSVDATTSLVATGSRTTNTRQGAFLKT